MWLLADKEKIIDRFFPISLYCYHPFLYFKLWFHYLFLHLWSSTIVQIGKSTFTAKFLTVNKTLEIVSISKIYEDWDNRLLGGELSILFSKFSVLFVKLPENLTENLASLLFSWDPIFFIKFLKYMSKKTHKFWKY